jgi:hypothetical protein
MRQRTKMSLVPGVDFCTVSVRGSVFYHEDRLVHDSKGAGMTTIIAKCRCSSSALLGT